MSIFVIKKCSFRKHPTIWVFKGVRLFQGVRLLFFQNFPGDTFIPDGTIIPYFRVHTYFNYCIFSCEFDSRISAANPEAHKLHFFRPHTLIESGPTKTAETGPIKNAHMFCRPVSNQTRKTQI